MSSLQKDDGESGFTLVEILVSLAILTVVLAAIFTFLWGATSYWQSGQDTADLTENARLGLNRMTRELEQGYAVTAADQTSVSFSVDFGSGDETITYGFTPATSDKSGFIWWSSSANGSETSELISDVKAVQFSYFGNDYRCDLDGNGLVTFDELSGCSPSPMSGISRVDIHLTMGVGSESQQTFDGQAWLRNRVTVQS